MEKLFVKSPANGYWILVNGPTYNKLKDEGYILDRLPRFTRDQISKTSPAKTEERKKTTNGNGKGKGKVSSPKKSGDKGVLSEYGYSTKLSSYERHYSLLAALFDRGPNLVAEHLKIRADQNRERNPTVSAIMNDDLIWLEKEIAQNIIEEETKEEMIEQKAATVIKPLRGARK